MIAWAPAAAGSRTATRAAAAMNRPTDCRFIWASLSIGCFSALRPELKCSWSDDRHRRDHPRQHGRLQQHQDADEAGEGDAVPEDVAQDPALLALLGGGHARTAPPCPSWPVPTPATTMLWASIILPMTPPLLLLAQARMGLIPSCSALIRCTFPT